MSIILLLLFVIICILSFIYILIFIDCFLLDCYNILLMNTHYILAIDQGTSSTKSVLFDNKGGIISKAVSPLQSYYPEVGFVEQKPLEILESVLDSVKKCIAGFNELPGKIETCGISNQRETFLLWDKNGEPLYNAVVWQCKRSVSICSRLKEENIEKTITKKTGLIIDPYFSGTKLIWLYENINSVRTAILNGKAYFGTVDTWLLYKLTGQYRTDYTNASRTLFFNIDSLNWDSELLDYFKLKTLVLPEAHESSYNFGTTDFNGLLPYSIPITAVVGDSHAASFGEGCFYPGTAKATMGTGSSVLMNIGQKRTVSKQGMITTINWSIPGRVDYALEGIIVTAGAALKWLKDQLGLFTSTGELERITNITATSNGVCFIPAFSGMGAPFWKMDAKAAITNLTFGCHKNHIIRAALESIPYQLKAVLDSMEQDSGISLQELKVDGGVSGNNFLMQFLSNVLSTKVVNPGIEEVSALGAAYLAGLQASIFKDIDELEEINKGYSQRIFSPDNNKQKVLTGYKEWLKSVKRVL